MGCLRDRCRLESPDTSLDPGIHQHLHSQVPYVLEDWIQSPHDGTMQRDLDRAVYVYFAQLATMGCPDN